MKIHVRRRHIEKGKPCSAGFCPLALALAEAVGVKNGELAYVGPGHAHVDRVGLLKHYELPRSAKRFIKRFDAGLPVKPFAFVLK